MAAKRTTPMKLEDLADNVVGNNKRIMDLEEMMKKLLSTTSSDSSSATKETSKETNQLQYLFGKGIEVELLRFDRSNTEN